MKINFSRSLVLFFLLFAVKQISFAQLTVPNYTACPNQVIIGSATWNNVGNITYSLYFPGNNPPGAASITWNGPQSTFTLAQPGNVPTVYTYTMIAYGTASSGTVINTAVFTLTVIPPSGMTFTNTQFFCNGSPVTFTAQPGGTLYNYTVSPSSPTGNSSSNVITIPGLGQSSSGNVTVTSVINGCTVTGQTNIQIAPLKVLSVTSPTNSCDGVSCPTCCITLTASLPGSNNDYIWYDNTSAQAANASSLGICNLSVNNAGTYSVTVNDQFNGILCPYTASTQVNIVQTSAIAASASPSNIVCQGSNINLSASAGNNPTWSWTGPSLSSSAPNPVISNATPANSGNYSVTATFQGGFLVCTTKAVVTVTVIPIVQPQITMPAGVCEGGNIAVSATANINPLGGYYWSGPLITGTVPNTAQSFNVSGVPLNATGTQFVTAKFGLTGVSLLCPVTASAQLNVVPVSTVLVVPPGPICSPNNAFLQSLANGASQYNWVGPNNYVGSGPNVTVYYPTPAASGIYTVTASFMGGNLTCYSSNTLQLNVYPVLNFSLIPRQELCYNSSVTISGPSGATSYTWTSSTGYTSNNRDVVFPSAQPNNSGTYTLNVSLGPCQSSQSSELVILDPITFTLTPFDRTVCRGDTIYLEGGATGGSENYAYTWNPGVYLESPTGSVQIGVPLGSVVYNLMVYDISCPTYTISHPFNVIVNQPPIPKLELATSEGCVPLCLNLDTKVQNESAITTFDFGGRRIFQRNDSTGFDYCIDQAGVYNLKIYTKGYNGCGNTYEYPSPITVDAKPGSDFIINPEVPTTNDEITFYPTFKVDESTITHMTWSFLGGVTNGDTTMNNMPGVGDTTNVRTPKRYYSQYGEYPVALIAQTRMGCIDTIYKAVKVIDEFQIFVPNSFTPNDDGVNDVFMAKGTGVKAENFTMDIFNRAGINIFTSKDINQGWDGKVGGQVVKDAVYIYKIRAVGMNGEGRREFTGYVTIIK